jgi:hypothetical protein
MVKPNWQCPDNWCEWSAGLAAGSGVRPPHRPCRGWILACQRRSSAPLVPVSLCARDRRHYSHAQQLRNRLAAAGRPIPLCLTAIADEFGDSIPCCPYADNCGDHIGKAILKYRNRSPAILLGDHGVFAWGASPSAASKAAMMTEDVAKTVFIAMQLGQSSIIPPEEAEKWYDRYHHGYGQF